MRNYRKIGILFGILIVLALGACNPSAEHNGNDYEGYEDVTEVTPPPTPTPPVAIATPTPSPEPETETEPEEPPFVPPVLVGLADARAGWRLMPIWDFDDVLNFSGGTAAVYRDGQWAFVDETGNLVSPFEYEDFTRVDPPAEGDLSNGFTITSLGEGEDQRWGKVDQDGIAVIPIGFHEVRAFSEGLAWVRQGPFWGIIELVD